MDKLLLFVFVTHMPFFAWRYYKTRELRYAATTVTFALLVLTYGLRMFAPGIAVSDVPLYVYVRVPAWISAVFSVGLLLRHAIRPMMRRPPHG